MEIFTTPYFKLNTPATIFPTKGERISKAPSTTLFNKKSLQGKETKKPRARLLLTPATSPFFFFWKILKIENPNHAYKTTKHTRFQKCQESEERLALTLGVIFAIMSL